jgi:hypothetical protein
MKMQKAGLKNVQQGFYKCKNIRGFSSLLAIIIKKSDKR